MDTESSNCQACNWQSRSQIEWKSHDSKLCYLWAALFHADWSLKVNNHSVFITVIQKVIAKMIETMKEFYQEIHQDSLSSDEKSL